MFIDSGGIIGVLGKEQLKYQITRKDQERYLLLG